MPKTSAHIRIDLNILDEFADQLSHAEFRLLTYLLRHAKNGLARPSIKRLAAFMKCTERSIRRYRAKLESLGLIQTIARFAPNGRQRSNGYRIRPVHERAGADKAVQPPVNDRGGQASPAELLANATREKIDKAKAILRQNGSVYIRKIDIAWQLARM